MLNLSLVNNLTIQFEAVYVSYCRFIYRSNLYVLLNARLVVCLLFLAEVFNKLTRVTQAKETTFLRFLGSSCQNVRLRLRAVAPEVDNPQAICEGGSRPGGID